MEVMGSRNVEVDWHGRGARGGVARFPDGAQEELFEVVALLHSGLLLRRAVVRRAILRSVFAVPENGDWRAHADAIQGVLHDDLSCHTPCC